MKIVTWNIGEDERHQNGVAGIDTYEYIANFIIENEIDIVCFEEAIISFDKLEPIGNYIKMHTDLKYVEEFNLSDSHINLGAKMGVVVCSKYELTIDEKIMMTNPKLVKKIDENTTFYSHDKGFMVVDVQGIKLVCGHCLPFHVFDRDSKEYLEIFSEIDSKLLKLYESNNRLILCGDFNYNDIDILFPKMTKTLTEVIKGSTKKDKQLDHLLVSDSIEILNAEIIDNIADHKCIMAEIKI